MCIAPYFKRRRDERKREEDSLFGRTEGNLEALKTSSVPPSLAKRASEGPSECGDYYVY